MAPRTRSAKRLKSEQESVKNPKFDQESVEKALVNMIIADGLPFSVVEQDEFKERMEAAFPGFRIPSCEMVSRECAQRFVDEKLKLKSFIKGTKQRVCLSMDTWRSNESVNYLCVTAHFVDDNWKLHKKVIGFSPVSSDDGEEIGRVVEKCLHDWGIDNVLAISASNTSLNDAAVRFLGTRLASTMLDGKYLRLKCFADLTNNMVKALFKDFDKWITRVRVAVRYMLRSPARIEKFKAFARRHSISSESFLCLDCPSRWSSTYDMLDSAQKFEELFDWFEEEDRAYMHEMYDTCGIPVYINWEKVRKAVDLLEAFCRSTESILWSHVTSNMFLGEIVNISFQLDEWGMSCAACSKNLLYSAVGLNYKFDQFWGDVEDSNMLMYVANILDPCYKLDFMEIYIANKIRYKRRYADDGEPLWKKKAEWVVARAYDLFNEYAGTLGAPQQKANFQTSGYMDYLRLATSPIQLAQKREVGFGGNAECKTEIDIYLNEELIKHFDGFDVLAWWKANSERFPVLSKMAKDVFSIPISAVALDSNINGDGNLLDDFQSSLSPSMVEALVCTQDWINNSNQQIKVHEGSTKLDKFVEGIIEQLEGATNKCGPNSL